MPTHGLSSASFTATGSLDTLELTAALRSMDMYSSQKQVREMLIEMDADKSGTVELRELLEYLRRHGTHRPETPSMAEAEAVAELVCKDGSGPLDCEAVSKLLSESF